MFVIFHRQVSPEYQRVKGILDSLKTDRVEMVKAIPTTPVMEELSKDEYRETHIQVRGNFLDPGETVTADVPEVFHEYPETESLNRLGLREMVGEPRQPTDREGDSQSLLVEIFWPGVGGDSGGFWNSGRTAHESGAPRLGGGRFHGERLEPEGTVQEDGVVRRVSSIFQASSGAGGDRSEPTVSSREVRGFVSRLRW